MKILVSLFGCDQGKSGIGRYTQELVQRMAKQKPEWKFTVTGNREDLEGFNFDNSIEKMLIRTASAPIQNTLNHLFRPKSIFAFEKYDALFIPGGNRRVVSSSDIPLSLIHI